MTTHRFGRNFCGKVQLLVLLLLFWVVPAMALTEGFESGNLNGLPWVNSGDASWVVTSADKHAGVYSAASPTLLDDQVAVLSVALTIPAGPVSFWFKVDSENGYDFLEFWINEYDPGTWNGWVNGWSGDSGWVYYETAPLPAGTYTFYWSYTKDAEGAAGADRAWIDDIVFPQIPPVSVTVHSLSADSAGFDWSAAQAGVQNVGSYVKLGSTYYYVGASQSDCWSGAGYNCATLWQCNQQTGAPLTTWDGLQDVPTLATLSPTLLGTQAELYVDWASTGNFYPAPAACVDDLGGAGSTRADATMSNDGELVWPQFDPLTGYIQLYSNLRGRLTSDAIDHLLPAVNAGGDVVWSQDGGLGPRIWGVVADLRQQLSAANPAYTPAINDNGEVVWVERDPANGNRLRVYSATRGYLSPADVDAYTPDLNNSGDVVWSQYVPGSGYRIYKLDYGTSTPVLVSSGVGDHYEPTLNDSDDLAWINRSGTGVYTLVTKLSGQAAQTRTTCLGGSGRPRHPEVTNRDSGGNPTYVFTEQELSTGLRFGRMLSDWRIVHGNNHAADWADTRHPALSPGSYLQIGGTFYYVVTSGDTSSAAEPAFLTGGSIAYNWAVLGLCNQENGIPLLDVASPAGDPLPADMSGLLGAPLRTYATWPGQGQTPGGNATVEHGATGGQIDWLTTSFSRSPQFVRIDGIYYKVTSWNSDSPLTVDPGFSWVQLQDCSQASGVGLLEEDGVTPLRPDCTGWIGKQIDFYLGWPDAAKKLLAVITDGTGAGVVVSTDSNIDTSVARTAYQYPDMSAVTLSATATAGSIFMGWSGAMGQSAATCSGTGDCVLTMDQDQSIFASFRKLVLGTVVINSGDAVTAIPEVVLTLGATSGVAVTEMRFSDDNVNWSAWEPYTTSRLYNLPSGDGARTVYVQFKDADGFVSVETEIKDDIYLDYPPTGSVLISDGAAFTNVSQVSLALGCSDPGSGCAMMRISNDGVFDSEPWQAYAPTLANWPLPVGDGVKTVAVEYVDGNYTVSVAPTSDDIVLDTAAPQTSHDAPIQWVNAPVTVTLTPGDATSGVATTHYCYAPTPGCTPTTVGTSFLLTTANGTAQTFYFSFYSTDAAGNAEAATLDVPVRIDRINPVTTHNAPAVWVNSNVTVTLTPGDSGSGLASTRYCYDTVPGCTPVTTGSSIVLPIVANGSTQVFYFSYYSTDVAGNVETTVANVPVRIDRIKPVTTHNAPIGWQENDVLVTLTPSDADSGVSGGAAQTLYCIDTTNTCVPATVGTTVNVTLSAGQQGTQYVRFSSSDAAGNVELIKSVSVQIDKTAPVTIHNAPAAWVNAPVTVTLAPSDSGSGVVGTWYCYAAAPDCTPTTAGTSLALSTTNGTAQTWYFSYFSTDLAGNVEATVANIPVRIDRIKPVTSSNAPTGWQMNDVLVTLTPSDADSGMIGGAAQTLNCVDATNTCVPATVGTNVNVTLPAGQQGTQYVRFFSTDAAGNVELVKSVAVQIDKTAPVTTHNAPAGWMNTNVTVTLAPGDSGSGLASTRYCYDTVPGCTPVTTGTSIVLPVVANGSTQVFYFRYYSTDLAGNVETTVADVPVRIDRIKPVTTSNAPTGWQANDVVVTLAPSDADSGMSGGAAQTLYCVDATNTCVPATVGTTVNVTLPAGQQGLRYLRFFSTDAAGNLELVKSVSVQIDKTAPVTTNNAPAGWVNANFTVTLAPSDSGSGVANTRYCFATAPDCTPTTSGASFSLTATNGTTQIYYFSYYSTDLVGNAEATVANVPVRIDRIKPVTSSSAPSAPSGWYKDDVPVTLLPSDADSGMSGGAAQTLYCVDATNTCVPASVGTSVNVTLPAGQQGSQYVRFFSTDAAGNVETVIKYLLVTIDKTLPVTTHNAPAGWVNSDVTVTLSPSDSGSKVATTFYCFATTPDCAPTSEGTSFLLPPVPAGSTQTYYVSFYSIDLAGNVEVTVANIPVRIDKVLPVTTDNAPTGWQRLNVTVTLAPSDADSGPAQTFSCIDLTNTCTPTTIGTSVTVIGTAGVEERRYLRLFSSDAAGNAEVPRSVAIDFDKKLPVGSITINGGVAVTRFTGVTLALTCNDGTGSGCGTMRFSNDGTTWTGWEPVLTSRSWALTVGDATKTVYAQFRDLVGNVQQVADTIDLDQTAPVITLLGAVNPYRVALDSDYLEPGYTASDTHDGTLTASVVVNNQVNTSVLSPPYQYVYYNVSDAAGNTAVQKIRTVEIYSPSLNPPTSFTVPASDPDGTFTLTWVNDNKARGVQIEESTTGTFTGTATYTISSGSPTSFTPPPRSAGKYYYQIRSTRLYYLPSEWVPSTPLFCEVSVAPPSALLVPAVSVGTQVALSWNASSLAGVTYTVEEATNAGFTDNLRSFAGIAGTATTVTQTMPGNYYYRVKAVKPTFVDSTWTVAASPCTVNPFAAPPSGLSVPALSAGRQVTLSWVASPLAGVTYRVQVASDPGYTAFVLPDTLTAATTATLTFAADGVYYYQVRAEKADYLESVWAGSGTSGLVELQAAPPSGLNLPALSSTGSYTVQWTKSSTPMSGYELQEATAPDFSGATTYPLGDVDSYMVSGKAPGQYYYRIRAVQPPDYDSSDWVVSTPAFCMVSVAAPMALTVPADSTGTQVALSWSASPTPGVLYTVEESTDPSFAVNVATYPSLTGTATTLTQNVAGVYYYRVKAVLPPFLDSPWADGDRSCNVYPYALAPATLTVPAGSNDGSIVLSWSASSTPGAIYVVQESTSLDFTGAPEVYRGSELTTNLSGKASNVTYYYRVLVEAPNYLPSLVWTAGNTGCFVMLTVPAPGMPVVPAFSAGNQVSLSWAASALAGVTYSVEESRNAGFTDISQTLSGIVGNATVVTNNTVGTYYYRVKAVKADYLDSPWASNSTNGCQVVLNAEPPTGLVVPGMSANGNYTISWTRSATVGAGYELQESVVAGDFSAATTIPLGDVASYDVTGKGPGNYYYRIRTVIVPYQPSDWVTGGNACQVPLANSNNFTVPASSTTGSFILTWSAVALAEGYEIEESTSGTFTGVATYTVNAPNVSLNVTGRAPATYLYQIRAIKAGTLSSSWIAGANGCRVDLLQVLSPNGGEVLLGRNVATLSWSDTSAAVNHEIRYSTNGGTNWTTITTIAAPTTTYDWTVPVLATASSQCLLQVRALDGVGTVLNTDTSNATFTINVPVTVTYPNVAGLVFNGGTITSVNWSEATGAVSYSLWYSTNNGSTWSAITTLAAPASSYNWTVPFLGSASSQCLIRVRALDGVGAIMNFDLNDNVFTINVPVTVTYPNATGLILSGGQNTNVNWTAATDAASYEVSYSLNGGSTWVGISIVAAPALTTVWAVPIPASQSTQCLVRVRARNSSGVVMNFDVSNNFFTINVPVLVTYPNAAGLILSGGQNTNINWSAATNAASYEVSYSLNNGSTWVGIRTVAAPALTTVWTVPIPASQSTQCLIRVRARNSSNVVMNSDVSNNVFTINVPVLVTYPTAAGVVFSGGQNTNINWSAATNAASYEVSYSLNGGSTWLGVTTVAAPTLTTVWSVPIPASQSTQCLIRVRARNSSNVVMNSDVSNNLFTINVPVAVTYPNAAGLVFSGGQSTNINWTSATNAASYELSYSTNGGTTWLGISIESAPATTYVWTVPVLASQSTQCLVRVRARDAAAVVMNSDVSNNVFTINVPVMVTYPSSAGLSFNGNQIVSIGWVEATTAANYELSYSTNAGSTWTGIGTVAAPATSYDWTVPALAVQSTECLVRVRALNGTGDLLNQDVSDNSFTINASAP